MYTPVTVRRLWHIVAVLPLLGIAVCCGCAGFFEQPDPQATPINFRVENGASNFVEVTVTVASAETTQTASDSPSEELGTGDTGKPAGMPLPEADPPEAPAIAPEVDAAETEPEVETEPGPPVEQPELEGVTIGVRAPVEPKDGGEIHAKKPHRALKEVVSEMTIRVSAQNYTDGALSCGDEVTIAASIGGAQTTSVLLTGAGTGTTGFDEGSIGLEGERLLLNNVHFECGDTLVVRVTDTGDGDIEVLEAGTTLPEPSFGAGASVDPDTETLEFRINNQTASFVELLLSDEPLTSSSSDEEASAEDGESTDSGVTVRVPPAHLSTGVISCGPQVILMGTIVLPAVDTDSDDTFNNVVLTGTGTGTIDFDENSVGPEAYQRLLLQGIHFECGDVVQVDFTDDGDPTGEEPTIGEASVSIGS